MMLTSSIISGQYFGAPSERQPARCAASYPTLRSSLRPAVVQILSTPKWFSVKVPVLSELITLVDPSVSTVGRKRMIALCCAMVARRC